MWTGDAGAHWTRVREERRQSEIMPWLLTGMTRWRVEANRRGRFWGMRRDSIRCD